jgi:dihydrofolate reductase
MPKNARVRVYMACSFDGFIAGPDHDISWLHQDHSHEGELPKDPDALEFDVFLSQVGAMLMGRATYEVVAPMAAVGPWSYGELPILVATRRPLTPVVSTISAAQGTIEELIEQAKALAGDKDVYLDGGDLVRQALDAGLVDELTITFVPILLGQGIRLFEGLHTPRALQFSARRAFGGGMLQVSAKVGQPQG